jgi:hypothetical protein
MVGIAAVRGSPDEKRQVNVTYSPVTAVLMSYTASYGKPADGPQQSLLHPSREREPAA